MPPRGISRGKFKVLGTQSREHLFPKWEDQGRPPKTRNVFELDLETLNTVLAHQDAQHVFIT